MRRAIALSDGIPVPVVQKREPRKRPALPLNERVKRAIRKYQQLHGGRPTTVTFGDKERLEMVALLEAFPPDGHSPITKYHWQAGAGYYLTYYGLRVVTTTKKSELRVT